MAVGVISTLLVLIAAYRHFILRRVHSAWRTFNVYVNRHVVVMILLGFIWWCVVRTSALTEPSTTIRQQQTMLPDVASRLVGSSAVVRANIRWANSVSCPGIVGCLLGAVFAAPASGRTRLTQRETLTKSVGGYKARLSWGAPHEMQLPCADPDEHNENAQCAICYDNIEERGDINVLVMECGHWVCASINCRPKRQSKWNQRKGRDEEVDLECPRCCYPFPYWRVRATSGLYAVGPRGGFPTQTPGL